MQAPAATSQLDALVALDALHDDLLRRLDELDLRIAEVLKEHQPVRSTAAAPAAGPAEAVWRPQGDSPVPTLIGAGPGAPTC